MRHTLSDLSSNPVFVRLCGRNRWLPPAYSFMLVLVAQSTVTTLVAMSHLRSDMPDYSILRMMLLGWLAVLLTPPIITITAARNVLRYERSDTSQLLALTNMTSDSWLNGYVTATLYRMRLFLLVLGVIMSWLASGMAVVLFSKRAVYYLLVCPPNDVRCGWGLVDSQTSIGSVAAESVLLHLMIWGLIYLAASVGVIVSLKWHNMSFIIPLLAISVLLLDMILIYGWTTERWSLNRFGTVGSMLLQIGICAMGVVLNSGIRRLARRWV